MRARPHMIVATVLAVAALSLTNAGVSDAHPPTVTILRGDGLATLRLGARQPSAITALDRLFGRPTTRITATPDLRNCGVNAQGTWRSMSAYFFHGRLVGLSFGPGRTPSVRTDVGLRLGETLARARTLYGTRLTTSGNNGGSWFVSTPVGRIDGFLNPSGASALRPAATILTMDVGSVGCPAMSP